VFVCPALMWVTGALSGLDGRSSFLLGNTVNQISEFSLILANQATGLGIFSQEMYLTIVVATLITFVLSSMGHMFADPLYQRSFKRVLSRLDTWSSMSDSGPEEFKMEHHVVLLGFNAIALEIAEYYRHTGVDVLVIQLNPNLHQDLQELWRLGRSKDAGEEGGEEHAEPLGRSPAFRAAASGTNIYSQYADPTKPDTWHHYHLTHASMVVSCEHRTTESDCVLARELAHCDVAFLCIADRCCCPPCSHPIRAHSCSYPTPSPA